MAFRHSLCFGAAISFLTVLTVQDLLLPLFTVVFEISYTSVLLLLDSEKLIPTRAGPI